jgi:hypothetical protein
MGRQSLSDSFDVDDDDIRSLKSLDLEEAKAMLRDEPEQTAYSQPRKRRTLKSILQACSVACNLFLFALILAVLGNPCYFSSRKCHYSIPTEEAAPPKAEEMKLLSEEHGLVPECECNMIQADAALTSAVGLEKVVFMNDSRYANEEMFTDSDEYDKILKQWEEDMPRKFAQKHQISRRLTVRSWPRIRLHTRRRLQTPSPSIPSPHPSRAQRL